VQFQQQPDFTEIKSKPKMKKDKSLSWYLVLFLINKNYQDAIILDLTG